VNEETSREEIEETRVLAMETIKIRPIVRGLFANVKKSFAEACVKGFKTGFVTFFESLSNNIKKDSNKLP
jgi:hypothetical protein